MSGERMPYNARINPISSTYSIVVTFLVYEDSRSLV